MLTPIILTILTFVSTFLGGIFGLKHHDKLKLILGFTAGVLLSVVAFDIFPEIISLLSVTHLSPQIPMIALVSGFLVFHILEKSLLIHHSHEAEYASHKHPTVGVASAIALALHSFLDGFGIGLGFQVSSGIGLMVAIAVIAHDFSDGLNTVSLMLVNKNTPKKSFIFLIIDSLAPVLGVIFSLFFNFPPLALLIYLGFFAGFLLYIGASDILPEAHSDSSSYSTILFTILGVFFIFLVTQIAK